MSKRKAAPLHLTEESSPEEVLVWLRAILYPLCRQVKLLQLLWDIHKAQCALVVLESEQKEQAQQVQALCELPPLGLGPQDALAQRIERLKVSALATHARKQELQRKLQEGLSGPAAAPAKHGWACPTCACTDPEAMNVFRCGHSFCPQCSGAVSHGRKCTVCQKRVLADQAIQVGCPPAGAHPPAAQCDPDAGEAAEVAVAGSRSIKLLAALRRLVWLARTRPGEAALVFSQFPEALKLLGHGLTVNGVKHAHLAGSKQARQEAIKSFNTDPSVRVFLLPHSQGATGLTLVRANHVVLLEPALDPSIEQQAIARAHRIGQTRPVTVHRLLVRGTVEEQVLRIQESKQALLAGGGGGSGAGTGGPGGPAGNAGAGPAQGEGTSWADVQQLMEALLQ